MKFEVLGSAAAGFFAMSSAVFLQFGTSWVAVIAAMIGAVLAVLELENIKLRFIVVVLIFNAMIGALGGPLVTHLVLQWTSINHPAVFVLLSFGIAYLGHDAFSELKGPLVQRLAALLKGGAK
ncbi:MULTISPECIES: hypothetical protein [Roseobacteraceae]|uniref:hypothetical protein n=1 Tax=Roseobacteraceae TaxID=2854170 RepID=UPI003B8AEDB6